MCGRYTAAKDFNELINLVGVIMARAPFLAPRYNIAPPQLAPVIYMERHQPAMKLMRWGLIPSWAKDESVGKACKKAQMSTKRSLCQRKTVGGLEKELANLRSRRKITKKAHDTVNKILKNKTRKEPCQAFKKYSRPRRN
jgi:putative SOS response-associated peptidase YedK